MLVRSSGGHSLVDRTKQTDVALAFRKPHTTFENNQSPRTDLSGEYRDTLQEVNHVEQWQDNPAKSDPCGAAPYRNGIDTIQSLAYGGSDLSDGAIITAVLNSCPSRRQSRHVAEALLSRFGSLQRVIAAPISELKSVEGVRPNDALFLNAVHMVALRVIRSRLEDKPVLSCWQQLLEYLHAALSHGSVESFRALFLDSKNRVLSDEVQAQGTVDHVPVYVREIVKSAVLSGCSSVILAHSHPSGDPKPSETDISSTIMIKAALKTLEISLQDHVIVGNGRYYSLRQNGVI
jgi:DNA repair protein RadC